MPRIYVASLSDYNSGRLHGAWIDLDGKSAEEVHEEIRAMLAQSREEVAEEFAIHDFKGFAAYPVGEYDAFADLIRVADLITEHGEIVTHAIADGLCDLDGAGEYMRDHYAGAWKSLEDYAADYVESCGLLSGVPDVVARYFDYEAFARDLELGGDVSTVRVGGELHVFTA